MNIASLILSIIALLISIAALTWQLALRFSSHKIQMVPVNPFEGMPGGPMGSPAEDAFRELGDPIDKEELDRIELMRQKKGKMT